MQEFFDFIDKIKAELITRQDEATGLYIVDIVDRQTGCFYVEKIKENCYSLLNNNEEAIASLDPVEALLNLIKSIEGKIISVRYEDTWYGRDLNIIEKTHEVPNKLLSQ